MNELLSECAAEKASSSTAQKISSAEPEPASEGGILLITACNDFENMSSKQATGLDVPHSMLLKAKFVKSYSSSSSMHSFSVTDDGKIYAMGRNDRGQLGLGHQTLVNYPVLMQNFSAAPGVSVKKIACGRSHSLFLMSNGEVYGCGCNEQGQLGLGESKTALKDSLRPVKLPFSSSAEIRDIACGHDHSLACDSNGRALTFGHPEYGQCGFGSNGSFIKDGGKGANVQYRYIRSPRMIELFVVKDARGKVDDQLPAVAVFVRAVAAGKNHSMCLEDWEEGRANRCVCLLDTRFVLYR